MDAHCICLIPQYDPASRPGVLFTEVMSYRACEAGRARGVPARVAMFYPSVSPNPPWACIVFEAAPGDEDDRLNGALLYSIAAVLVLGVVSIVVFRRARAAERDKLLARQEVSERERSEAALKAALLRSEAAEAQVRRGRHLLDTVANMARIGGWELDLATMMPIWSDEAYRIHEVDAAHRPTFPETMSFYPGNARAL